MPAIVGAARGARLDAAAEGLLEPRAGGVRPRAPNRRRSPSTCRRRVPRKLAAIVPSQPDGRRPSRSRSLTPTMRSAGSASSSFAARTSTAANGSRVLETAMHIDILDDPAVPVLRRTARAGRRRCSIAAIGDEIHDGILGCHCCIFPVVDGIPVLHLQPAASHAREHIEAGTAGARAAGDGRPRRRGAGASVRGGGRVADRRPTRTSSRRSDRASRAATSSIASPIRPSSWPTPSSAPWRGTVLRAGGRAARHLRRFGTPDAIAHRLSRRRRRCWPTCSSRRSGWRGASRRLAAKPSAATATRRCRSRAARSASRCAPTRSCTSGPSGSSSARCSARSTGSPHARPSLINHTHNQLAWSPSHGQPLRRRATATCSRRRQPRVFGEARLFADVVDRRSARPVAASTIRRRARRAIRR